MQLLWSFPLLETFPVVCMVLCILKRMYSRFSTLCLTWLKYGRHTHKWRSRRVVDEGTLECVRAWAWLIWGRIQVRLLGCDASLFLIQWSTVKLFLPELSLKHVCLRCTTAPHCSDLLSQRGWNETFQSVSRWFLITAIELTPEKEHGKIICLQFSLSPRQFASVALCRRMSSLLSLEFHNSPFAKTPVSEVW